LDKIQEGMSATEVKSILGSPSDSKSEPIPIVGGTKTTYVYTNKEDRVVIVLKNDTVQTKEGHFSSEK
ncbi:MAG TPA: outer membrane protein assembly factor BamE, partial [Chthoniobacterales bacterium]|nr:outer membrane protein assembly factor BamE [Chthoniobacterales bacterium]